MSTLPFNAPTSAERRLRWASLSLKRILAVPSAAR
jgi:hypothetical protein